MITPRSLGRPARTYALPLSAALLAAMLLAPASADEAPRLGDLAFPHDPGRWRITVEAETVQAECLGEACNDFAVTMTRQVPGEPCDPAAQGAIDYGVEREARMPLATASPELGFDLAFVDPGCVRYGTILFACTRFGGATYSATAAKSTCGDVFPNAEAMQDFIGRIRLAE